MRARATVALRLRKEPHVPIGYETVGAAQPVKKVQRWTERAILCQFHKRFTETALYLIHL